MDYDLRSRLWNALCTHYWDRLEEAPSGSFRLNDLIVKLWHDYFKRPIDTMGHMWGDIYLQIRQYYFECKWYEVYDFIEFVANNDGEKARLAVFMDACNSILEQELSAYRFVHGKITQITSEEEIAEIEEALETPIKLVNEHLKTALDLLADRKSPDYRNSIKESISAVEALCRLITKDPNATLGQALKVVREKVGLHPALEKAFSSLYGYTSSAEGIRHALLEEPNLDFEIAKFMLVSCSGFINYLISKSSRVGVDLA